MKKEEVLKLVNKIDEDALEERDRMLERLLEVLTFGGMMDVEETQAIFNKLEVHEVRRLFFRLNPGPAKKLFGALTEKQTERLLSCVKITFNDLAGGLDLDKNWRLFDSLDKSGSQRLFFLLSDSQARRLLFELMEKDQVQKLLGCLTAEHLHGVRLLCTNPS